MIVVFMPRHFGFCLSVGLELGGFKFKSRMNLEQVCKNKKLKKVPFSIFHLHLNLAQDYSRPSPFPFLCLDPTLGHWWPTLTPPHSRTRLGPGGRHSA